jgi:hypothetical protein
LPPAHSTRGKTRQKSKRCPRRANLLKKLHLKWFEQGFYPNIAHKTPLKTSKNKPFWTFPDLSVNNKKGVSN